MEVTGKSVLRVIPSLAERAAGSNTGGNERGAAGVPARNTDKVVLSPRAREIDDAKNRLLNMPDIRSEKVRDIKHRIDDGTYVVKGDKIAFRMLKESILNQPIKA